MPLHGIVPLRLIEKLPQLVYAEGPRDGVTRGNALEILVVAGEHVKVACMPAAESKCAM
jgi:hypothetical protein